MIVPIRILVIDDNPAILDLIRDVLSCDYDVEVAQDALTGLECVCRNHHQLLILDLGLAGAMDGPELVRLIRSSNDGIADTPIVVVSAYPEMRKLLPAGSVSAFIAKPFLIENMLRVVTAAIRDSEVRSYNDKQRDDTEQN